MSDLISRSEVNEVVDVLEVYTAGRQNTMKVELSVLQLQRIINKLKNVPTAYDADNVVAELKNISFKATRYPDSVVDLNEAIKIVKNGGADDDVCEWEKGSSGYVGYPAYYSKCCTTNSKGLEMQTHIIADWKFCPYCGKKIKIVGD